MIPDLIDNFSFRIADDLVPRSFRAWQEHDDHADSQCHA
jgi:hypothetical protein